jgi:ribosome-binding factor A
VPRVARVNALLAEVLGEEIERLGDVDERLVMLTVTGVETEPDLRHATVFLASLPEAGREALEQHRVRLQAVIARQVRLRRTPSLRFLADPAVVAGAAVEAALRRLHASGG